MGGLLTKPALAVQTEEGRKYVHPITGEMVPSVTTITGVIQKDLADWAAKQSAQCLIDNWAEVKSLMNRGDDLTVFNWLSTAHIRTRDEASAKGDLVHDSAEARVKGNDDGNSPKHMKQLDDFLRVSGFTITHTEVTLWNSNIGYAGTADAIGKDRYGRPVLIDYKTGKNVYDDAALQLEALSQCTRIVYPDGTEEGLSLFKTVGILHLRPQSWWWHPIQDKDCRDNNWYTFLACKRVYEESERIREWKRFHPNMIWGNLGKFNEANWPNRDTPLHKRRPIV